MLLAAALNGAYGELLVDIKKQQSVASHGSW